MTTGTYVVSKGSLPQSTDIDQVIQIVQGTGDGGKVYLGIAPLAAPTSALTAAGGSSGGLTGSYAYVVTYVTGVQQSNGTMTQSGETTVGTASTAVSLTSQLANLSAIPTGPTGTIARNIYRNKSGGSTATGPWYLVTQIPNNTSTTFVDNVPDASLGAQAPSTNTTGTYMAESTLLGQREMIPDYDQYMSSPDGNDIYTVVTLKRPDGTRYFVSTLSNPSNGLYQTDTWQFYDPTGNTVVKTHVWSLTYDASGRITQKVMTS